jgi:hypothetical protein
MRVGMGDLGGEIVDDSNATELSVDDLEDRTGQVAGGDGNVWLGDRCEGAPDGQESRDGGGERDEQLEQTRSSAGELAGGSTRAQEGGHDGTNDEQSGAKYDGNEVCVDEQRRSQLVENIQQTETDDNSTEHKQNEQP